MATGSSPRPTHERENRGIEDLCRILQEHSGCHVEVVDRPDRRAEGEAGCDAILVRDGQMIAVEHTTIHQAPGKPGQLQKLAVITPVIRERLHRDYPNARIRVFVQLEAIDHDWAGAAKRIAAACSERLRGDSGNARMQVAMEADPTAVAIEWQPSWPSGGACYVSPGVWGREPTELTIEDIRRALRDKHPKMSAYRAEGYQTLLLLESSEPWVPWELRAHCCTALELEPAEAYDSVWVAFSSWSPPPTLPVKLDETYPVADEILDEFVEAHARLRDREGT